MSALPILVVYGAFLWKVALLALAAGLYHALRRWLDRGLAAVAAAATAISILCMIGAIADASIDLDDLGVEGSEPVVVCHDPRDRTLPIGEFSAEAIAAAMPNTRSHALAVLQTELACQFVPTKEVLASERGLDELQR